MELRSIGIPEMKIANLFEDVKILKQVQELALKIITEDPNLKEEKNTKLKRLIEHRFTEKIEM